MAVGKKTEMLATGGSDAVVNLWYDSTASDKEEAFRKEVNHLCNPSNCPMCVCVCGERETAGGRVRGVLVYIYFVLLSVTTLFILPLW